jgi:hypothetical protein
MPAVSVVMAVYNGERHLAAAVDSILAQTHQDFELVIVDDGSTDGSRDIVRSYGDPRIRLVTLDRNSGLSAALNRGLATARAPLIARQDADDLSEPHRLATQLAVMRERPALALLGSRAFALAEDGRVTGTVWRPAAPASIRWYALFDNPFIHTSVMFRAAVVRDELGGFDARYDPFSQDYALWCRVLRRYPCANLPERLVRYRVHSASIIGGLDDGGSRELDYRRRFAAMIREIIAEHAGSTLAPGMLSERDIDLLAGFILGVPPTGVPTFLNLFERLLAAYNDRHATAADAQDLAQTLARQFDALALRVEPWTRRSAVAVYAHALRRHPELARHLPWSRALVLAALGKQGRIRAAGWRRRIGIHTASG